MSDTDDTDVLLLIPPDFFFVNSDTDCSIDGNWNEHCRYHCNLVDNIAGELGVLKNRLNCFENLSISSSLYSIDRITESDMSSRKYQFPDDFRNRYISNSTNSTPQKPRTKLVANSLPSTPSSERENIRRTKKSPVNYENRRVDGKTLQPVKSQSHHSIQVYNENDADVSSLASSPDKKENKVVMGEIDQFLSHVKNIKKFQASKKLENDYPLNEKEYQSLPMSFDNFPLKLSDLKGEGDFKLSDKKRLDIKDIDQLIQSLEEQQEKMDKVPITNRIIEGNETQTHTWKPGENMNSVPDYNFGIRNVMYAKEEAEKLAVNIDDYLSKQCNPGIDLEAVDSDTTNEITPPTVYENPIENYLLKKPQNELTRIPTDFLPPKNVNVFDYVTSIPANNPGKTKIVEDVMVKKSVQSNVNAAPIHAKRNLSNEGHIPYPNTFGLPDLWKKDITYQSGSDVQIYHAKLEEEKMRRQHCEKLIQELQLKHLEMQQRLAVAVQVDCAKDVAILKFHKAWERVSDRWAALEAERNQLSQRLNNIKGKTDHEASEAKKKIMHYENEISKALDLAHTSQDKVNNLEFEKNSLAVELETLKKNIDELRNKLKMTENEKEEYKSNLIQLESQIRQDNSEVENLRKELNFLKAKSQNDIICFQNELKLLREEKAKLEKQVKDTSDICSTIESKNKTLENTVEAAKKNEKNLHQEINKLIDQQEKAKVELRSFYQQQVEILVKDKLKEFQSQLESTEKSLHEELQLREQNIAKTAAKQLQKYNDKHQIEIQLLEQKHKEEINLYEIQIQQLKHLIATQQNKLDHMQIKRNNIAQELKTVMEAQWNEALKIIDNGRTPNAVTNELKGTIYPKPVFDINYRQFQYKDDRFQPPEHERQKEKQQSVIENIETPRTSKERDWHEHNNELHKYIKMLLDKEPGNPTEGAIPNSILRNTSSSDCADMRAHPEAASKNVEETDTKAFSTVSKEYRASKPPWK